MPFPAQVFNVLIASPSDVPSEREAIAASLHDWNSLHSQVTGYVLLPVMWESHSAPAMGDRPQGIINAQVVRSCDMLIGAFWTKLGSPTGVEESGTVEEIKFFLKNSKPVMLYYSKVHADLDTVDLMQVDKLKAFKASIRDKGIQEQYSTIEELKQKLARHLTIVIRGLSVDTFVDKSVVREARESSNSEDVKATVPSRARTKTKPDDQIVMVEYSDKSFVVKGNTLKWKTELIALGGKWITLKEGGKAWNFSKRRLQDVANLLKVKAELGENT